MADDPTLAGTPNSPAVPTDQTGVTPAASPTAEHDGDHAASPPAPSGDHAASPPAETRESLLDVVQRAVEARPGEAQRQEPDAGGASQAPSEQPDPNAPPPQAASQEDPGEVTAEELASLHPKTQKQFKKLIDQRRQLYGEVERLSTLEPHAHAAIKVRQYLADNDISEQDFETTLQLAVSLRRADFRTFYEGIKPYVQMAEEYLGISLPPDLQEHVRNGHMTTQAAHLYQRERMDRQLAENQHLRSAHQFDTQRERQAREVLADNVHNAVTAWEQRVRQTDPDYSPRKAAAVQDTMWAVVRQVGVPQTPEQAVAIAQESLRRVNEHYRSMTPPRRATLRVPSSTGRTNGAMPQPNNFADAVKQAAQSFTG